MLFAFIKRLFQKSKLCLHRLFSQNVQNIDEENSVDRDKLMVAEKKVLFTKSEYEEFIKKFPAASPAIVIDIKGDATTYFLKNIKDLHEIQKRDGNQSISDECIEYAKNIKNKAISSTNRKKSAKRKQTQVESSPESAVINELSISVDNNKAEVTESLELNTKNLSKEATSEQSEIILIQQSFDSETSTLETSTSSSLIIQERLNDLEKEIDDQEKLTTWKWRRLFDSVVGSSHLRHNPPIPCQDSALVTLIPRPAIFVADGAGSARLSHFGSSAVVEYLNCFIASIEDINQDILDQDRQQESEFEKRYAYRFSKYAIQILKKLSEDKKESIDLFKCTLLITIIGKNRLFWLKIGDGFIVIEEQGKLKLLGPLGKGDFANQTTFLSEKINHEEINYGFTDARNITGIAAFTDGAGEKLVSNNGLQISGFLSKLFQDIRTGDFTQNNLHDFLSNKEVWLRTTGDDKSISILSYLE